MGLEAAFIQGFAGSRSKQVKFAVNGRAVGGNGRKTRLIEANGAFCRQSVTGIRRGQELNGEFDR
jgi:hypothetical protein